MPSTVTTSAWPWDSPAVRNLSIFNSILYEETARSSGPRGRLARVGRRHDACTGERLVLIRHADAAWPRSTSPTLADARRRAGRARTTRRGRTDAAGAGRRAGAPPGREGCRGGSHPARAAAVGARARGGRGARVGGRGAIGRGAGDAGAVAPRRRCGSPRCDADLRQLAEAEALCREVRRSLTASDDLARWATAVLARVSLWQARTPRRGRSSTICRRATSWTTVGLRRGHGRARAAWRPGTCSPRAGGSRDWPTRRPRRR